MRLLTCEKCPHDKSNKTYGLVPMTECEIKERVRKAIKGNGIQWTAIQFRCTKIKDELPPGLIVTVNILTYEEVGEDWYDYEATIIGWKGRKVLVWLHDPGEYIKSKWDVVKVWPKNIDIPRIFNRRFDVLCPECKKPVNRPRKRIPTRESGVLGFFCDTCRGSTGQ